MIQFNRRAETHMGCLRFDMMSQLDEGIHQNKVKSGEIYRPIQECGRIDLGNNVLFHKEGRKIPISLSRILVTEGALPWKRWAS